MPLDSDPPDRLAQPPATPITLRFPPSSRPRLHLAAPAGIVIPLNASLPPREPATAAATREAAEDAAYNSGLDRLDQLHHELRVLQGNFADAFHALVEKVPAGAEQENVQSEIRRLAARLQRGFTTQDTALEHFLDP